MRIEDESAIKYALPLSVCATISSYHMLITNEVHHTKCTINLTKCDKKINKIFFNSFIHFLNCFAGMRITVQRMSDVIPQLASFGPCAF